MKLLKAKYGFITISFILINLLFIEKYGSRQDMVSTSVLQTLYTVFVVLLVYFIRKSQLDNKDLSHISRGLYYSLTFVLSAIFIYVINNTVSTSINVDRWSALEITVKGLTEGIYPYTQIDHLGGRSSNFPALGFIALPFYILGDVGYLQVFTFILFAIYNYETSQNKITSLLVLVLFTTAPSFLWEVSVKSDLLSNILLFYMFIDFWFSKYSIDQISKPISLGIVFGFFLMTRGVLIIPMTIFFLIGFLKSNLKAKVKLSVSTIGTILLLSLPTLFIAPDWNTIVNYNPIVLQTNKTPSFSYFILGFTFIIPWFYKNYTSRLYCSFVIILSLTLIALFYRTYELGFFNAILERNFNFSYLNICLPAILFWLLRTKNNVFDPT